jgi:ferredoxin-NADP reductase
VPGHETAVQLQRYLYVRGLLDTMLSEANNAVHVFGNPHLGTSPMSLEIHELNMSPMNDARAEACVVAMVCTRACWAAVAIDHEPVSVSALHLISAAVADLAQQIDGFSKRSKLEMGIELLQSAAFCLPQGARHFIRKELTRWTRFKHRDTLGRWASRNVSGAGTHWDGEYVPITRLSDDVVEFHRAVDPGANEHSVRALYRDPGDHVWKFKDTEAEGAEPNLDTEFFSNGTNADEPPLSGWFLRSHANPIVEAAPLDTYTIRTAVRSFLSNGTQTLVEQLRPFADQNFDIFVLDDALLQWLYMKAARAVDTLPGTAARAVAHTIVKHLAAQLPSGSMPPWSTVARKCLEGDVDEASLAALRSTIPKKDAPSARENAAIRLLCSAPRSSAAAQAGAGAVVHATLDKHLPVAQCGAGAGWPLTATLTYPAKDRHTRARAATIAPADGLAVERAGRATRSLLFGRTFALCGQLLHLPPRFWFVKQLKQRTLFIVVLAIYGFAFWNCACHIGGTDDDLASVIFLPNPNTPSGLPPQYNMADPVQNVLVPLVYAVMHCNLVTFGLLPLPMCRCTIRWLSCSPVVSELLHLDHVHFWHRVLGYVLIGGVLLGGVLWWLALGPSCANNGLEASCDAFHPPANEKIGLGALESYVNFYANGGAVLFLRELVVTGFIGIFSTALLIYPLGANAKALSIGWVQRHAFEIFYYTHVAAFVTITVLAFSSRFEVFYPTLPLWAWYALDVLYMRLCHTHTTSATATFTDTPTQYVHLKIRKTGTTLSTCSATFNFQPGQTAFVAIPAISKLEWHPFSIASAPSDEHVEFLIDASKYGPRSWTGKLWHALANKELSSAFRVKLMGPCGSAFQTFDHYFGVMLVGGGSGLTSSLSVLRGVLHQKRSGATNPGKVWLVWVVRHVDSLIWCWDALKRALEGEGTREQKERNVAALDAWLDVSIHVTGCARMPAERQKLDRLIASEQGDAGSGLAGGWLVHGDKLQRSRIKSWRSKFLGVHAAVPKHETVKVCFCGPTAMAHDIHAAAGTIKGFSVQVSSENFNEGKRPTPVLDSTADGFRAAKTRDARSLTEVFNDLEEFRPQGAAQSEMASENPVWRFLGRFSSSSSRRGSSFSGAPRPSTAAVDDGEAGDIAMNVLHRGSAGTAAHMSAPPPKNPALVRTHTGSEATEVSNSIADDTPPQANLELTKHWSQESTERTSV